MKETFVFVPLQGVVDTGHLVIAWSYLNGERGAVERDILALVKHKCADVVFTVDQNIMGPFVFDNSAAWQMSCSSKVTFLILRPILLCPGKFQLGRSIAMDRN